MKLGHAVALIVAATGFAASYALADGGHGQGPDAARCGHGSVSGTAAAPQTLTFTVGKAGGHTGLHVGDVVTVMVGSSGQQVRVHAVACTGTDGTITVRSADLHVVPAKGDPHHVTTTATTTN